MTLNIQISKKLNDGTILLVGGTDINEFMNNAEGVVGREGADELRASFIDLIPVSGGGTPTGNVAQGFAPREGAGAPPGSQTLCPSHQLPAVWKEGGVSQATNKPYNGFWKCATTGSSISNFDGKGLKPSCPPPK